MRGGVRQSAARLPASGRQAASAGGHVLRTLGQVSHAVGVDGGQLGERDRRRQQRRRTDQRAARLQAALDQHQHVLQARERQDERRRPLSLPRRPQEDVRRAPLLLHTRVHIHLGLGFDKCRLQASQVPARLAQARAGTLQLRLLDTHSAAAAAAATTATQCEHCQQPLLAQL